MAEKNTAKCQDMTQRKWKSSDSGDPNPVGVYFLSLLCVRSGECSPHQCEPLRLKMLVLSHPQPFLQENRAQVITDSKIIRDGDLCFMLGLWPQERLRDEEALVPPLNSLHLPRFCHIWCPLSLALWIPEPIPTPSTTTPLLGWHF